MWQGRAGTANQAEENSMDEAIRQGFMVFVSDGDAGIGSVREVAPDGRAELVIYVENAGDFIVPLSAVESVHADKVILDCTRLTPDLRTAINHAHDAEDRNFVAHSPVGEDSDAFSSSFIEQQRQRLVALRSELLGGEGRATANARAFQEQHGAEAQEFEERAQDMAQNEIRQARHDVDRQRLANIDRALRKIEEGTYGLSDLSGTRIRKARLAITPEALFTVEEEEAREKKT
jgi:DnaK suppressor protein